MNRLDDVITFNTLERKHIHQIIDISLDKLLTRVIDIGYNIELTEKAKDFLANKGYDAQYGARPLKRAIQKYVEDALAEEIIKSKIDDGDVIKMDLDKTTQELKIKIEKGVKSTKT